MANKRIRDLSERTTFSSGDYLATDNSSGTRKVDASKILTPISTAQSTADLVTSRVSNSGDAFSSTKGYDVGALVVAPTDNLIYRCKTAYSTGASWNSRKANFEQISMVKAVDTLNAALSNIAIALNGYKIKPFQIQNLAFTNGFATFNMGVGSVSEFYMVVNNHGTTTKVVYQSISNGTITLKASKYSDQSLPSYTETLIDAIAIYK